MKSKEYCVLGHRPTRHESCLHPLVEAIWVRQALRGSVRDRAIANVVTL
jgi:hypothetical protein